MTVSVPGVIWATSVQAPLLPRAWIAAEPGLNWGGPPPGLPPSGSGPGAPIRARLPSRAIAAPRRTPASAPRATTVGADQAAFRPVRRKAYATPRPESRPGAPTTIIPSPMATAAPNPSPTAPLARTSLPDGVHLPSAPRSKTYAVPPPACWGAPTTMRVPRTARTDPKPSPNVASLPLTDPVSVHSSSWPRRKMWIPPTSEAGDGKVEIDPGRPTNSSPPAKAAADPKPTAAGDRPVAVVWATDAVAADRVRRTVVAGTRIRMATL